MTRYHWKLLIFLSVATFFEGFDLMVLSQILPELRSDFGISQEQASRMIAVINVGTVLAFFLIRKADQWGRRNVLNITIAGYTICTGLSALTQDMWQFAAMQCLARLFLIAEWGIAMVYAAEEFPSEKRAMIIATIQGFSSFGSIFCAGVTPIIIQHTWGWRSLYAVGIIPLVLVAYARRGIKESTRFEEIDKPKRSTFTDLLTGPYRSRLLLIGLLWSLTYFGTSTAIIYWKDHMVTTHGWSNEAIASKLTIAALVSMPMIFFSGTLLERLGRRWGAVIIYNLCCIGIACSFTLTDPISLQIALILAIFGVSSVLPVLNAYGTELFPTNIRSEAYAWGNNIIGRIGYVLAPIIILHIASIKTANGSLGLGLAMAISVIFPLIALGILFFCFPETQGRDIDETAKLS